MPALHARHSEADLFKLLTPNEQNEFLDNLSDEDVLAIEKDWGFWGQPNQQIPESLLNGEKSI